MPLAAASPAPADPELPQAAWLDLSFRPPTIVVHPGDSAADAVAHLLLANSQSRAIKIVEVRISYLQGERELRVDTPGESFFRPGAGTRAARLDRGARTEWRGICLEAVPPAAERARIELELVARQGTGPRRVRQRVDAPLQQPAAPPVLQLPFEGTWQVSQGHGCATDHRLGGHGSDFAWDFVALDARTGRSVRDAYLASRRNRDSESFGRPVLAPAAGRVVRVEADVPDNDGLRDYPGRTLVEDLAHPLWNFGNFIVVDLGDGGPYVLLAHLRQGSIRVAPGTILHTGDLVAQVGNSGRTFVPHLHVQLMDRSDAADPGVSGIPARFRDYIELTSRSATGRRDSVLRRVTEGDPPEGSIVVPAAAPSGSGGTGKTGSQSGA